MNNVIDFETHHRAKQVSKKQLPINLNLKSKYSISGRWIIKRNLSALVLIFAACSLYYLLSYALGGYFNSTSNEIDIYLSKNFTLILGLFLIGIVFKNIVQYLKLKYFEYRIENNRLRINKGIIKKVEFYIPLLPITEITIERDFFDLVLGTANLQVYTHGNQKKSSVKIANLRSADASRLKQVLLLYCEHYLDDSQKANLFTQMATRR